MSETQHTPQSRSFEVWQRGPVPGYPAELQPAVHAFLGVIEEIEAVASGLNHEQLWARPGGVASVGFHLLHLAGSTDRLFAYALGAALDEAQRDYLRKESQVLEPTVSAEELAHKTASAIHASLGKLSQIAPESYQDIRYIGRARIESTVWGLVFHAAEHASRHAGQLVTTARIVRSMGGVG